MRIFPQAPNGDAVVPSADLSSFRMAMKEAGWPDPWKEPYGSERVAMQDLISDVAYEALHFDGRFGEDDVLAVGPCAKTDVALALRVIGFGSPARPVQIGELDRWPGLEGLREASHGILSAARSATSG